MCRGRDHLVVSASKKPQYSIILAVGISRKGGPDSWKSSSLTPNPINPTIACRPRVYPSRAPVHRLMYVLFVAN